MSRIQDLQDKVFKVVMNFESDSFEKLQKVLELLYEAEKDEIREQRELLDRKQYG